MLFFRFNPSIFEINDTINIIERVLTILNVSNIISITLMVVSQNKTVKFRIQNTA